MDKPQQAVIRLSLRWILIVAVLIVALGFAGGLFGASFNTPITPLTPQNGRQLVTTVQEVTVSPDSNIQSMISSAQRSVLLLASGARTAPVAVATASVVTNDGLLATIHPPATGEVFAIDSGGNFIDLDTVGKDVVYGITFYRIRSGVLPAIELANGNPTVGVTLSALSRSPQTVEAIARNFDLQSYTVPTQTSPPAWHRVGTLHEPTQFLPGTPLLFDDGKVAGITAGKDSPTVLPITYIRRSLERLASGKREANPFETFGFSVEPTFAVTNDASKIDFAFTVTSVDATGPAGGLRVNDQIATINDQELTWEANIIDLLSVQSPIILEVQRGERQQTITLTNAD